MFRISCYVVLALWVIGVTHHDECTDIDMRSVGSPSLSNGGGNCILSDSG